MSKNSQGYQYTVKDFLKVLDVFAFVGGIILFALKAASVPMDTVSETKVSEVLVAHGYTPTDETDFYQENYPTYGVCKKYYLYKRSYVVSVFCFCRCR